MTTIYWGSFHYNDWRFYLAATEKGLCYVGSPDKPFEELEVWVSKKVKNAILQENTQLLTSFITILQQYLHGEKKQLDIAIDPIGTTFQKKVWEASCDIPYGETKTYQEIAEIIENPKAVRAVGTAIGANPLLFIIPCHRIVAKSGSLSGFRAGIAMKRFLLDLESAHA